MKKYISVLTIAALGVLALSCAKEMDVNQDNTGKSISKVFTATLEKDDDVTKTEIQSDKCRLEEAGSERKTGEKQETGWRTGGDCP